MRAMRPQYEARARIEGTGAAAGELYKSPQRKLVRFFEKSRTQWKAKCRAAKATIKVLKNRIRFLEESKAGWKRRAQALEEEITRLTATGHTTSRQKLVRKKNAG